MSCLASFPWNIENWKASTKKNHKSSGFSLCEWFPIINIHYVKNIRIRRYSGKYFPAFELNTERYGISLGESHGVSVRMRENTNQKYSKYGQFLRSDLSDWNSGRYIGELKQPLSAVLMNQIYITEDLLYKFTHIKRYIGKKNTGNHVY